VFWFFKETRPATAKNNPKPRANTDANIRKVAFISNIGVVVEIHQIASANAIVTRGGGILSSRNFIMYLS
jgi:hypothetical protein